MGCSSPSGSNPHALTPPAYVDNPTSNFIERNLRISINMEGEISLKYDSPNSACPLTSVRPGLINVDHCSLRGSNPRPLTPPPPAYVDNPTSNFIEVNLRMSTNYEVEISRKYHSTNCPVTPLASVGPTNMDSSSLSGSCSRLRSSLPPAYGDILNNPTTDFTERNLRISIYYDGEISIKCGPTNSGRPVAAVWPRPPIAADHGIRHARDLERRAFLTRFVADIDARRRIAAAVIDSFRAAIDTSRAAAIDTSRAAIGTRIAAIDTTRAAINTTRAAIDTSRADIDPFMTMTVSCSMVFLILC